MDDALEAEVLQSLLSSHSRMAAQAAAALWTRLLLLLDSLLLFAQLHLLQPQAAALLMVLALLALFINDRCLDCVCATARWLRMRVPGGATPDVAEALQGATAPLEWRGRRAAAFAIQGQRAAMEDRFDAEEEILLQEAPLGGQIRPVSIYGVYDGHGGDFAAEYTQHHLVAAIKRKLRQARAQRPEADGDCDASVTAAADDCGTPPSTESTAMASETAATSSPSSGSEAAAPVAGAPCTAGTAISTPDGPLAGGPPPHPESSAAAPALQSSKCHDAYQRSPRAARAGAERAELVSFLGEVNYSRLMQEVFAEVDAALLETARRQSCIAGTTAVVALVDGDQVVVASCGDSRAVLCDARGNAVSLSTDHKPDQLSEKKRITEAGGFVTFNGVWRVNGILATSRALGDLPFKERRLLTCRPDVQTVSVRHHAAPLLLLASDGLWDAVSAQEAVSHVRSRLHEPELGARSLALLAYQRGSLDNITVVVVDLRPGQVGRSGSFRRAVPNS